MKRSLMLLSLAALCASTSVFSANVKIPDTSKIDKRDFGSSTLHKDNQLAEMQKKQKEQEKKQKELAEKTKKLEKDTAMLKKDVKTIKEKK